MFIAREQELSKLNKFYIRDEFQLVALYGRRRVGKTELMKQFAKDKTCLFFSAEETTEILNLRNISELYNDLVGVKSGSLESWEMFFDYIVDYGKNRKLVIIFDEFPYLQTSNSGFLSKFQHIIDHKLKDSNLMMVICGSSIGFMEEKVFSDKSPLFGRLNGQIFLKPFDYYDAAKMFENYSFSEKLEAYFILGGIPQYLRKFNTNMSIEKNIKGNLLDSSEELYHAPENLLRQELRSSVVYNSIIEVIAEGASKSNEINTKIGVAPNVGQNYLSTLMQLQLVEKLRPIGSENKRKTIYKLSDNLFDFVYRFVFRNRSLIEFGATEAVFEGKIKPHLQTYYGKKYEVACIEYMKRLNVKGGLPDLFEEIGPWWGGNPKTKVEEEIDLVAITKTHGLYGECKYTNKAVGTKILEELRRKSMLIPRIEQSYYLFSNSGFTVELIAYAKDKDNIYLVGLEGMFDI